MSPSVARVFSFGPRRAKRFVIWLLVVFVIPMLAFLPELDQNHVVFTVVARIPLALVGIPYFELHEFGAVPQGSAGYGIVIFVYAVLAFFLSIIGKRDI